MGQTFTTTPRQASVGSSAPRHHFWRRSTGVRARLRSLVAATRSTVDWVGKAGVGLARSWLKRCRPVAPAPPPPALEPELSAPLLNPLVRTAAPLLALMARLPMMPAPGNLEGLRHRIIAALRRFQSAARAGGVSADQMRTAHFALCVALDDIVSHTVWGRQANWNERSLIRTFHKTIEPDRDLITLLDHMIADPQNHICELELIALCMALGFEGRYRTQDDGPPALRLVRDQIDRVITQVRGAPAEELSPEWRAIAVPRKPLTTLMPPWVATSLIGAVFAVFYVILTLSVGGHADRVYQKLVALLPDRPAVIVHLEAVGSAAPAEAAAVAHQISARAKRFQSVLGADAAAGMVEVVTEHDTDILRISGVNAFLRGGDTLTRAGHQLVERLAPLLEREPGRLLVVGHTDDHPNLGIRHPSALALSEARARSVARVLVARLSAPERIDIEGRAYTEPLVPNTSTANRDRNRRVEIILPHGEVRR